jgi:hypothetical protein
MKYAVEMHTGFRKDCFSHSKVDGRGYIDRQAGRQNDLISLLSFLQNEQSRPIFKVFFCIGKSII